MSGLTVELDIARWEEECQRTPVPQQSGVPLQRKSISSTDPGHATHGPNTDKVEPRVRMGGKAGVPSQTHLCLCLAGGDHGKVRARGSPKNCCHSNSGIPERLAILLSNAADRNCFK